MIARFRSRSLRVGPGFALLVALTGCLRPPAVRDPVQREFWNSLRVLCGRAFPGTLVRASGADTMLARSPLVLDVWQCYDREVRLAFHVGDDRSRVWLLSPVQSGLRLAHALHRADGSTEEFSEYGGLTRTSGTAGRQEFLADERTVRDVPSAATTVWALELVPRERLTYALRDAAGERFRVDFDLARTAAHPPTPWGYTRTRGPSPPDSSGS